MRRRGVLGCFEGVGLALLACHCGVDDASDVAVDDAGSANASDAGVVKANDAGLASDGSASTNADGDSGLAIGGDRGPVTAIDLCPSAVLSAAPKPVLGNCSTRDGRSRVAAPLAPRVSWVTSVPVDPDGDHLDATSITTDATGHAYVASAVVGPYPAFTAVDASTGSIDWTFSVDGALSPMLVASGAIDFLRGSQNAPSIIESIPLVDASQPNNVPPDESTTQSDPAIGSDGSFYFDRYVSGYVEGPSNTLEFTTFDQINRAAPDGTVTWSSPLLYLSRPVASNVEPTPHVVIGANDSIILATEPTLDSTTSSNVIALDPRDGHVVWNRSFPGPAVALPTVAHDGSIAFIYGDGTYVTSKLVILEPTGAIRTTFEIPAAQSIPAIALDGTVLVFGSYGTSGANLMAIERTGQIRWTLPMEQGWTATIASNGIVIAQDRLWIAGVDLATGAVKWKLSPPHPGVFIEDTALTSLGTLVAVQIDGTLFGASD